MKKILTALSLMVMFLFVSIKSDCVSQLESAEVLLWIDGYPALTVQEYEEQLETVCLLNPQIKQYIETKPYAKFDFVFRGMATVQLLKAWAKNHGLEQSVESKLQLKYLYDRNFLQVCMKKLEEYYGLQGFSDMQKEGALELVIQQLKQDYNVVVNTQYFADQFIL